MGEDLLINYCEAFPTGEYKIKCFRRLNENYIIDKVGRLFVETYDDRDFNPKVRNNKRHAVMSWFTGEIIIRPYELFFRNGNLESVYEVKQIY